MSENWKSRAVEEHTKIYNSLNRPHFLLSGNDFSELIKIVDSIITEHNYFNGIEQSSVRKISAEIIKNSEENFIKFHYSIIVTNSYAISGVLCKVPVFVAIKGNELRFIDVKSKVHTSWAELLTNISLPPCECCYPVNGIYNVGAKLEVGYATVGTLVASPSTVLALHDRQYGLLSSLQAIASFFYQVPMTVVRRGLDVLTPIANLFINITENSIHAVMRWIHTLFYGRNGNNRSVIARAMTVMETSYSYFINAINHVYEKIRDLLMGIVNSVKGLRGLFSRSSTSSQNEFIAAALRIQCDVDQARIVESTKNDSDAKKIFEDCKLESSFNSRENEKNIELSEETRDLLQICGIRAEQVEGMTLNDATILLQGLSKYVLNDCKNKMKTYTEMIKAAKIAAGKNISEELLNKELGINGDPRNYFWKESLNSIPESKFLFVYELIDQMNIKQELTLIPVAVMGESKLGLYRSIGIKGNGKLSAAELINALKEHLTISKENLDEMLQNVNETTHNAICMTSSNFLIFAYQKVDETNTSDGFVYVGHTSP